MKRFIIFTGKCAAICSVSLLLLLLVNHRYKQVWDNPYTDTQKFNYMNSNYNNIQISNIGSSHGEYGFYYEELTKERGYECFNFAMASQTYNYDYAILSMYADHFADNSILFIPVSYFSFNNEVINETERQSLSAKYYTFLSPKYIPDYDPYVDIVTHRLPVLSAGEDIIKIFPSLSLTVFAAGDGAAPDSAVFYEKALNRYQRHFDNKETRFMDERIDNLYAIINLCKESGITPVMLTTPYTDFYSDMVSEEFESEFYHIIYEISKQTGVPYYNYSEDKRFTEHLEYFSDADHLNNEGASLFMGIIAEEIPEFREFLADNRPMHAGDPDWKPEF